MRTPLQIKASVCVWCLFAVLMLFITLALCAISIPAPNPIIKAVFSQFSLSSERTPPAFFSFLLLLICGVWLGAIALHERQIGSRWWRHWAFLAMTFVLMSYDEAAQLHEKLIEPLRELLGVDGFFYYAWVIPGMIVVAIFFVVYLPFLYHLPRVFAGLFLLSGAIYVSGAIGLEMISGNYIDEHGRDLIYRLIATVEEAFEMFGAWLFIYSLVKYLTCQAGFFEIKLKLTNGASVPVEVKPKRRGTGLGWASLTRSARPRGLFRGGAGHRAAPN